MNEKKSPQEELDGLLFTLELCKKELPADTHSAHFEHLRQIEAILKAYYDAQTRRKSF